MKKFLVIANWKMNLDLNSSFKLAKKIKANKNLAKKAKLVLCPTFISLERVGQVLKNTKIGLGSQDVFWRDAGSFTGEVSAPMLKKIGCRYVILGHSERRQYLGETDEVVNKKLKSVLDNHLIPIVCVGENKEERKSGKHIQVIKKQLSSAFKNIPARGWSAFGGKTKNQKIVIAYEPIWAIGTGVAINSSEAGKMHGIIREQLEKKYGNNLVKNNFIITYGGSIDKNNISEFTKEAEIEGVLVGGASQKWQSFRDLIKKIN